MLWLLGVLLLAGPPTGEPVVLTFPAATGRLDTGLYVTRGESLSFEATGEWTMWDGHFGRSNALGHRYRVGLYGWGQLMARIGSGAEVAIGTRKTFTAADSGALYLYPNLGTAGMPAPAGELQVGIRGGRPVGTVIDALAAQGIKLTLPADGAFVPVWVDPDHDVRFDVFGEWTMYEGGRPLTANGDAALRLPDGAPLGQLQVRCAGPTFGYGDWQPVGSQRTWHPRRAGLLELRPAVGPYAGHTRGGSLTVIVRGGHGATEAEAAVAARGAQDYERGMAYLRLCQYRRQLLLPRPACSPALMKAAQAHAEYLAARDTRGHAEDPPTLGYTGAGPLERALAMGFPLRAGDPLAGAILGEGLHGYTDGLRAIDGLWATVGQRAVMADPAATEVGVGVASGRQPVCVLLLGTRPGALPKHSVAAAWPSDGQSGVAPSWSGREEPAVLPDDVPRPVGPLLSLTLEGKVEQVSPAELSDERDHKLPVLQPSPVTVKLGTTVYVVPRAPLRSQQTYHLSLAAVVDGQPRTFAWRFITGSGALPPLAAPRLDDPANPPLSLDRWVPPAPPG